MERAIFFDRDGTLLEDVPYLCDPGRVRLLAGAATGLRALRALGYRLVLVSNQSGVGRGLITRAAARAVHLAMIDALTAEGLALDGYRYCEHAPADQCGCRKPSPQMIMEAAVALGIDQRRSYMVGDKVIDTAAGAAAGCRTVLLGPALEESSAMPDRIARNWHEVLAFVAGDS